MPGGELTPDQLICMGKVAKKYNLYTKVTGGQRIDMFGAEKHQVHRQVAYITLGVFISLR